MLHETKSNTDGRGNDAVGRVSANRRAHVLSSNTTSTVPVTQHSKMTEEGYPERYAGMNRSLVHAANIIDRRPQIQQNEAPGPKGKLC